jgi:hypothetical protein
MATLALATAAADALIVPGIDAAAAVPPVNTQPVATVGESVPAPAHSVAGVAPTAREAIQSAGARIAASAEKNPPVPPEFDVPMHEAGPSRVPVRHDFNRGCLSTAIAYSKERKYDGLSIVPHSQDQKSRYQLYTYHVGACIFVYQGPRHDQESINMVES